MKLNSLFAWILVGVLVFVGWTSVLNNSQIQEIDLSLETNDVYGVPMSDGGKYTLVNGVELEFVSMGDLKVGSTWYILVEVNGKKIPLEEGQYKFQDSSYEIRYDGNNFDLFKLHLG